MNGSEDSDTTAPKKKLLHLDNIKKGGVWGAVITTIASLGYAEIQRQENSSLLHTNSELVRVVLEDAKSCRDRIVDVYVSCRNAEED